MAWGNLVLKPAYVLIAAILLQAYPSPPPVAPPPDSAGVAASGALAWTADDLASEQWTERALWAAATPDPTPVPTPTATPPPPPPPPAPAAAAPAPRPAPAPAPAPRAFGSPYDSGSYGYDTSYPLCSSPGPLAGATFTVIGVNGGKAFTMNPCFVNEWEQGVRPRALYLNTGYNPDNAGKVTGPCQSAAGRSGLGGAYATAYAIGCSEADYSLAQVSAALGSWQPLMWWLDVETGNSWSDSDLGLNHAALAGALTRLQSTGLAIGVYSTAGMWQTITGGWSHPAIAANWLALADRSACGGRGFSGAPVWLVQPQPSGPTDSDWAC